MSIDDELSPEASRAVTVLCVAYFALGAWCGVFLCMTTGIATPDPPAPVKAPLHPSEKR